MFRLVCRLIALFAGLFALHLHEEPIENAYGASFDCGKATTKMEKAICGDAALSQLDEKLGAVYKTARATLSPEAGKSMADSQRSWLKFVAEFCFTDLEGKPAAASDATECMTEKMRVRIEELEATGRVIDGLKIYLVVDDAFRVSRAEAARGVIERSYEQVDGATSLALTLNTILRAGFEQKAAVSDDDMGFGLTQTASLSSVTSDILLITKNTETVGGAHPTTENGYRYFSKSLNRVLTFGDIFSLDSWRDIAKRSVELELQKHKLEPLNDPGQLINAMSLSQDFDFPFADKNGFVLSGMFLSYAERAEDEFELSWSLFYPILTPYIKQQFSLPPQ